MSKRTRNLIVVAGALAVVVVLALVSSHRGSGALPGPIQHVKLTTFTVKLPENGVVMRPHGKTVPTRVSGSNGQIFVKAGQRVAQDQLLATMANPTLTYGAAGSQADY